MSDRNDIPPLGASISEIIDRTTKIVHEEVELAKAEVAVALQDLLRGSVAGIVGGVFAFFGLFVLLIGISFLIDDAIGIDAFWPGFLIVALFLFVFGGILAAVALKKIKKGSQLVPEQAIAEAKATQAALQADEHEQIQLFDAVVVEEGEVVAGAPAAPAAAGESAPKAPKAPSEQDAAAAELLAKAQEHVAAQESGAPAGEAPIGKPVFVTELPGEESGKQGGKQGDKAQAKAAKVAAKEAAKAEKQAAKEAAKAEKQAAEEAAKAEKQAAKERRAAEKVAAKAAKKSPAGDDAGPGDEPDGPDGPDGPSAGDGEGAQ